MGALVLSNARRALSVRVRSPQRRSRVESDPIGLDDNDTVTPEPTVPLNVRTEAEATAAAGAAWPLSSIGAIDVAEDFDEGSERLAPKSMSEPVLDFDVDVDDFESRLTASGNEVVERSGAEQYDAVDPDSLGTEWLIRATETTGGGGSSEIDNISEVPMDLNPLMSEASIRAAEFNEDDIPGDASSGGGGPSATGDDEDAADIEDASLWDSTFKK